MPESWLLAIVVRASCFAYGGVVHEPLRCRTVEAGWRRVGADLVIRRATVLP